jgi:hypothetical protein
MLNKLFITTLCFAAAAYAQLPISVGVKGGVSLTDAFQTTSTSVTIPSLPFFSSGSYSASTYSDSKDYIVGPFVELRLPFGFAAEADALYRPVSLAIAGSSPGYGSYKTSERYTTWEISALAKYRFRHIPLIRPFVSVGPTFRPTASYVNFLSNAGISAGGGVEFKLLFLRIAPEVRYTHWGADGGSAYASSTYQAFVSGKNQAEFLVGLSF